MDITENNQPVDQVSRSKPTTFHQFFRFVKFESISIITVFFALTVTRGYAYLEKADLILGIPTRRMGYDSLIYAIYGGLPFTLLIIGICVGTSVALAFLALLIILEKPAQEESTKIERDRNSIRHRLPAALPLILGAFSVGLFSILLWLIMNFMVRDAQASAYIAAYSLIETCSEATITLKNTDQIEGCIVGETDDMIYLIKRNSNDNKTIKFTKIMLPKSALASSSEQSEIIGKN